MSASDWLKRLAHSGSASSTVNQLHDGSIPSSTSILDTVDAYSEQTQDEPSIADQAKASHPPSDQPVSTLPQHDLTALDFDAGPLQSQAVASGWEYWSTPSDATQLLWNMASNHADAFTTMESPGQFRENLFLQDFELDVGTPEASPVGHQASPDDDELHSSPAQTTQSARSETKLARPWSPERRGEQDNTPGDVTRQLTSRLGRLQMAEDGRPRYYGATSNLHLLHSGPGSLTQPNIRHVMVHGDAAVALAGLQWESDHAYESHLINLFFSWHNSLQFPVDKTIFLRERDKYKSGQSTDLFTPSLENAILCVGAAYTDRVHSSIDDSVDEFFALRTKAYLDIEIDSPTIATVQALLILSSHEAAQTRESRGWIYMGMATQIITDLGLHLDLEREYSRLGSDDEFDDLNITRRNVFWTVKSVDIMWSAYSGRPSVMQNLVHNQKSPLPSRTYHWEAYMDQHSTVNFPEGFDFRAAAYVHVHLASLMLILGRVSEVLYSGVPDMSNNTQAFVHGADADFQQWFANLPPNLRLDMKQPFHVQSVLELHLIYHESVILLHRPLITPVDAAGDGLAVNEEAAAISLDKCLESADKICAIVVLYRNRYGLKRLHHQMVHATMTAALIHVFQLCVLPAGSAGNKKAQASFLICIQALGEMGQTFKSASRALDVITSLRQSWRDDATAGDRFKRARLR